MDSLAGKSSILVGITALLSCCLPPSNFHLLIFSDTENQTEQASSRWSCWTFHVEPGIFKLLIVDSVMALFRVDFSGRGELAERQQNLAQMMSKLQKISEEYNVAVLVTNQMTADPGATMSFQADPKKVTFVNATV